MMDVETLDSAIAWLDEFHEQTDELGIVFHGGEPLTAGAGFFRKALPRLRKTLKQGHVRLALQSNLWLLTGELCRLFAEYGVSLGTSLDGPEAVNDAQRGRGYFGRTMAGIRLARRHGLKVGCICTFTRQSAIHAGAIMDFFISEGLDFSIHAAVPPLVEPDPEHVAGPPSVNPVQQTADRWAISPEAFGSLLVDLLDSYLAARGRVRISTLDRLCRSISSGEGGVCTYRDCLGGYLAVAPDGGIYPCQRFAGLDSFRLGNVQGRPSPEQLTLSAAWRLFRERERRLSEECGGCSHFGICRGGCPYNALAAQAPGARSAWHALKDPYCPSYQRIFSRITELALAEVFSDANMEAVVARPAETLLRQGRLLSIMRGGSRQGPAQSP